MRHALEFDDLDVGQAPNLCPRCSGQLEPGRCYACGFCQDKVKHQLDRAQEWATDVPHLVGDELRIPFSSPPRYHWWTEGGQPILQTLLELEAPCAVRARYENPAPTGNVLRLDT